MYERTLADGTILTFGHEGILYEDSFIMYDHDTASLWVHVTGTAIKGALKGTKLTFFPSALTTWKNWKSSHPDTLVLPGDRDPGFMGTYRGLEEGDFDEFGLAVFHRGQVRLYPYEVLARSPVLHDELFGRDVLVSFSDRAGVERAFDW